MPTGNHRDLRDKWLERSSDVASAAAKSRTAARNHLQPLLVTSNRRGPEFNVWVGSPQLGDHGFPAEDPSVSGDQDVAPCGTHLLAASPGEVGVDTPVDEWRSGFELALDHN